jgi:UDP-glucuronate decarboxylase
MHILLTGGTGFFGKALLRHWIGEASKGQTPPRVTVLSRHPSALLDAHPEFRERPWLDFHTGDVLQPSTLPVGARFTHLLHAATDSARGAQLTPLECYRQVADGTRHMLDYAAANGVRRFLLTSSGAVYGRLQGTAGVREDFLQMPDPLQPGQAYGVAKRAAEHLCALYREAHGLDTVVARCFAFVGPDLPLDVHFAIGNFIRDALTADAIVVNGDGLPLRSYMHQQDLADWLTLLLERGTAGEAYNVGSPESWSVGEIAHRVRDLLAPDKPVHVLSQGDPSSATRSGYIPNVDKALALGLKLNWSLDDAIRDTGAAARARGMH